MITARVPVTVLTGFLGAGKTTLLNHVLRAAHGLRIAVIENEFGEAGIDNELLVHEGAEQIVEMNNGCLCCTVRGDLIRILGDLAQRRAAGTLAFEHVIIETTGLADPAPVAQTFFADPAISAAYVLDAIVTVVDAVHAEQQLSEHHEAQEQIGFADVVLLSKTDLVSAAVVEQMERRVATINRRAKVLRSTKGEVPLDRLLGIRAFALDAILEIEPGFLGDLAHEHDDDVGSFLFEAEGRFDLTRLNAFLDRLIGSHGAQLMRYKGVLKAVGRAGRVVVQGVHMIIDVDQVPGEGGANRMVFIGRDLPRAIIEAGLRDCLVAEAEAA